MGQIYYRAFTQLIVWGSDRRAFKGRLAWPLLTQRASFTRPQTHINKSYFYDLKRATCDEDRNEAMS